MDMCSGSQMRAWNFWQTCIWVIAN